MFRRVAPLSCAYFAYVALSMSSVRGVNLPMYTTLRRTTAAFTMTAEYFAVGKRQSRAVTTAVGAMVAGAFVAALGDAHFDASGAFNTLVPIRPRSRGERRSLRTFPGTSLRPGSLGFNPRPRRLSTPTDAYEVHPDVALYGTTPNFD